MTRDFVEKLAEFPRFEQLAVERRQVEGIGRAGETMAVFRSAGSGGSPHELEKRALAVDAGEAEPRQRTAAAEESEIEVGA